MDEGVGVRVAAVNRQPLDLDFFSSENLVPFLLPCSVPSHADYELGSVHLLHRHFCSIVFWFAEKNNNNHAVVEFCTLRGLS